MPDRIPVALALPEDFRTATSTQEGRSHWPRAAWGGGHHQLLHAAGRLNTRIADVHVRIRTETAAGAAGGGFHTMRAAPRLPLRPPPRKGGLYSHAAAEYSDEWWRLHWGTSVAHQALLDGKPGAESAAGWSEFASVSSKVVRTRVGTVGKVFKFKGNILRMRQGTLEGPARAAEREAVAFMSSRQRARRASISARSARRSAGGRRGMNGSRGRGGEDGDDSDEFFDLSDEDDAEGAHGSSKVPDLDWSMLTKLLPYTCKDKDARLARDQLFRRFDKDGDGFLTRNEAGQMVSFHAPSARRSPLARRPPAPRSRAQPATPPVAPGRSSRHSRPRSSTCRRSGSSPWWRRRSSTRAWFTT